MEVVAPSENKAAQHLRQLAMLNLNSLTYYCQAHKNMMIFLQFWITYTKYHYNNSTTSKIIDN